MPMEQKKATELLERKKGGWRTMPFIIGDDPFQGISLFIHTLKIIVFLLAQCCVLLLVRYIYEKF